MLQCVENCGGCLGPHVKKFSSLFIHINFFKKSNKKNYNRAKELYCDATIFFLILYCLFAKKMKTEKWPKAVDSAVMVF